MTLQELADRAGLPLVQVEAIFEAEATERGVVTPDDLAKSMAIIIGRFWETVFKVPKTFQTPADQSFADEVVRRCFEQVVGVMEASAHRPS